MGKVSSWYDVFVHSAQFVAFHPHSTTLAVPPILVRRSEVLSCLQAPLGVVRERNHPSLKRSTASAILQLETC